jgi:hypothetical protein
MGHPARQRPTRGPYSSGPVEGEPARPGRARTVRRPADQSAARRPPARRPTHRSQRGRPKKRPATDDAAAVVTSLAELAAYTGPRETVSVETSPRTLYPTKDDAPEETDAEEIDFDDDDADD